MCLPSLRQLFSLPPFRSSLRALGLKSDREVFASVLLAAQRLDGARNCGLPVKTKTDWASGARAIAADTARLVSDRLGRWTAGNCAERAFTRKS